MSRDITRRLFINVGHFYAHLFMLLFPTVVLALESEFAASYGSLLSLATAGFVAFGAGSIPAGWLGDRWSRPGMMAVFFIGIGSASVLTGFARTPFEIGAGLLAIGVFASIYHPVGIALLVEGREKVGRVLGINGVFGNMGLAGAALIAGILIKLFSWQVAFIVPGLVAIATGLGYVAFVRAAGRTREAAKRAVPDPDVTRALMIRVLVIVAVATLLGGIIFNATTVALPKLFDERVGGLVTDRSGLGGLVAIVLAVAAFAQIGVGHLIDRYPIKPVFFVLVVAQVPLLKIITEFTDLPMFVAALVLMCLVFGEIPIGDTLVARHTASAWRGRVYGVKYVLALGVSASAVPLVAWLHDTAGFATLFALLAAFAAAIGVVVLALPGSARWRVGAAPSRQGREDEVSITRKAGRAG